MNASAMTPPTTDEPATTHRPFRARGGLAFLGLAGMLTLAACGEGNDATTADPTGGQGAATAASSPDPLASATVRNAEGTEVGTAQFTEADQDAMRVSVEFSGLEPGYYGLHVHGNGVCEAESSAPDDPSETGAFLSAGGHLGGDDARHPDHAGDLPALLVMESGRAAMSFETDRLPAENLRDDNGSALMIHSGPDNYANIPERYAPEGPDEDTRSTGDAGSRLACGVIE